MRDEKQKSRARASSRFSKFRRRVKTKGSPKKRAPPPHTPHLFPFPAWQPLPSQTFLAAFFCDGQTCWSFITFFLGCRDLSVLLILTNTHWLLGTYAKRDGWWWWGEGYRSTQWCSILTCSQSIDCFFFSTHAAMAVPACSESINSNHPAHLIYNRTVVFSKGSISNDWLGVCGNEMLVWRFKKKNGPPLFCIAPPAQV